MEHIWISHAVGSPQCGVHIHKDLLPVLYHPVHHLATEVPDGVVWQVPIAISGTRNPTVTNLDALLYGREQAIAIAFNLKMEQTYFERPSEQNTVRINQPKVIKLLLTISNSNPP